MRRRLQEKKSPCPPLSALGAQPILVVHVIVVLLAGTTSFSCSVFVIFREASQLFAGQRRGSGFLKAMQIPAYTACQGWLVLYGMIWPLGISVNAPGSRMQGHGERSGVLRGWHVCV